MEVAITCKGKRRRGRRKGEPCHRVVLRYDPDTGQVTGYCPECGSPLTLLVAAGPATP